MLAIKSEMQSPCTLMKTETTSVADALEDLTVNVMPKAESSFCFDYNETKCLQIDFMQHDNSFGQNLHDIKLDPADQKHWRCENVPELETNSQMSSSFIKIEWQPAHIVKTEYMTEHNHRVKSERALPGQDEVCHPNSGNEFYCNTYEVKTQYGLHHDENTNGPVTSEVKHEDHSGQEVGSIVKAELTKSHNLYNEVWNIKVATMMEHMKAQSAPQEVGYSCRKNKDISPFLSQPEQDVVVSGGKYTHLMDIVTESPQHETNLNVTEPSVNFKSEEQRHCKDTKSYECKVSMSSFSFPSLLKKHMSIHTGKLYKCRVCEAAFKTLDTLKQHMLVHSNEKPYQCSVCKAAFKLSSILKKHMLVHSDEKPHKCRVCEASFKTLGNLKQHMLVHSDENPHKCRVCEAAFKTLGRLKQHMKVHSNEKPYQCSVCKGAFKLSSILKRHMKVHSDEKPHKCRVCEAAFKTLGILKRHMQLHSNENPHKCRVCEASFKTLGNLNWHMKVHSNEKPHKCRVCEAAFNTLSTLKQHMLVHSDEKPHKCRVCEAAFKTLGTLKQHMLVHSDEKPHKCRVCEAAFKTLGNLNLHMKVHSNEKPYQCSVCKAAFKLSHILKRHMLVHSKDKPHKSDQKLWRCENVPKLETNSPTSSSFVKIECQPVHIVKTECMTEHNHRVKIERALPGQEVVCHSNSDNEFYCNCQSITFEVKKEYGLHHDENTNGPVTSEVKHEDHSEKPHKCRVCKASFKRLDNLKRHMEVHSDEKPHKCRVCETAFKNLDTLKQHMLVHSDKKPHKCRACEATFKTLGILKRHMQLHSNEKPYKCRVCEASFRTLGNLNWHMKVHSKDKPHQCSFCEGAFKTLGRLKKHMQVHSKEKPVQCL
ncbi:LOW QUALITY PROTEIN: zinc finger protein 493-like [Pomacea canaliculata]|uniref:LOW QUALITY PROTEIN: zinc finger protein 493-like n=1 Tax=Pomacea canaliculata TaxID=400727 RepID=UPI000D726F48|nr:LOW QUALITY PROTEIN: zinc finger protein 493-like [Pomacea canaliculata]